MKKKKKIYTNTYYLNDDDSSHDDDTISLTLTYPFPLFLLNNILENL